MIDVNAIRRDFPILDRRINGKQLAYLDSAATSQKPRQVIEAISKYYQESNANIHRGIHTLSVEATEMCEAARRKVADFVGVADPSEIVFVRNATEAINLVAYSWGRLNIDKGDEIVLTVAEHHSNFVSWQQLALENGAVLKVVPIRHIRQAQCKQAQGKPVDENGQVDLVAFKKSLTKRTKLVSFFHVSNVLGTINDVNRLSLIVHRLVPKAKILIDGAQAVPHMPVDIPKIGCDFYAFSGHKMLGPSGIGVLWAKREILSEMPPFLFGGEMISKVSLEKTNWNELPWKFEAGTPNIEGAIGLGEAVDYLSAIGMENVRKHEVDLTSYALDKLSQIPEVTIYGPHHSVIARSPSTSSFDSLGTESSGRSDSDESSDSKRRMSESLRLDELRTTKQSKKRSPRGVHTEFIECARDDNKRAGVISFNLGNIPPHDVASILDSDGVEIRSGYNCAEPLLQFLGSGPVARVSFYIYNTVDEIERLIDGINKVKEVFHPSRIKTRMVNPNGSEYRQKMQYQNSD